MINKLQKEIIEEFKRLDRGSSKFDLPKYLGTDNKFYHLKTAVQKQIAKEFVKKHPNITKEEFLELLNALNVGESSNERTFGTTLISRKKEFKDLFTPKRVFEWLANLSGWCEVDSLCQSTFGARDLLEDWVNWEKTITKMARDKNISRRRASLVLLTRSVRESNDERLAKLAFENLEKLKSEKDILITKAVSWILRSLIKHHREQVVSYINANRQILPKIAIRETERKLKTGRK
ncbi:MAG: DNA alkylation repair protein [Patescibacteria group bacterium]|nr:DNA alkylation repair protein [Patescibacteria group bacterium]